MTPRARLLAAGATSAALAAGAAGAFVLGESAGGSRSRPRPSGPAGPDRTAAHHAAAHDGPTRAATPRAPATNPATPAVSPVPPGPQRRPFAVGLRTLRFVDRSRTARRPDGRAVPRAIATILRYPASGPPAPADRRNAPAAAASGPYPLLIFGHGFSLLPSTYALLLHAVSSAGYVVAAPAFPLERADAPGGAVPDLAQQPGDVRFLITRLLRAAASPGSALEGLIAPSRIAVGGHSDGGATAVAVAYGHDRDPRVGAAVVLAGAGRDDAPAGARNPALLAIQGTADRVHPPAATDAFFAASHRPKYLLSLLGEGHESPYEVARPRRLVERVVVAFLDRYLLHVRGAARRLAAAGREPGLATLTAAP